MRFNAAACALAAAWACGGPAAAARVTGVAVTPYEVYTEITVALDKAAGFTCEAGAEPGRLVLTVAADAAGDVSVAAAGRLAGAKVVRERGATTFLFQTGPDAGPFRAYATAAPPTVVVDVYRRLELGRKVAPAPYKTFLGGRAVLLVDDDDGPSNGNKYGIDVNPRYEAALKRLGVAYDEFAVRTGKDGPDASRLAAYPIVVWFTGLDARPAVITAADEAALASYLKGGGRLLVVSQNYLSDSSDAGRSGFCLDALGLAGVKPDTQTKAVCPTPAAGKFDFAVFDLDNDLSIIGNWGDGFQAPVDGLILFKGDNDDCAYALARRCGAGRVAFFSFAVENVGFVNRMADILGAAFNALAPPS